MAIDFPTGPAVNDLYTYNSVTYKWDGVFWSPQLIGAISSFLIDDTVNTAVTNFTFTHTTTLTPGTGIGTGISLGAETSSGNVEIGATIEAVAFDATATSEDFDLRFKTMKAGAAATEVMRLNGDGLVGIGANGPNYIGRLEVTEPGNLFNLALIGYGNNAWGGGLFFHKTRNAAYDGNTVVQNGDNLGYIYFSGNDSTQRRTAAQIFGQVDGVPGAGDMPGRLTFTTTPDGSVTPVERLRIDSAGHVVVGYAGWLGQGRLEVADPGGLYGLSVFGYNSTADGGSISLHKTRNASPAAHTIVQSGDYLGFIDFSGSDGANWIPGAEIAGTVDGTPGTNDMPTRLEFATTPDGSGGPVERMRIDNQGRVILGGTSSQLNGYGQHPGFQLHAITADPMLMGLYAWSASASQSNLFTFAKSLGASIGTHTIVTSTTYLGGISFAGSDGTNFEEGAAIYCQIDGTPGANDMPAKLLFFTTPDGSNVSLVRMTIDNQGNMIHRSATVTPPTLGTNGDWVMTPTSNTQMRISYRGSDGTTRVGNITLA